MWENRITQGQATQKIVDSYPHISYSVFLAERKNKKEK